METIKSHLNHLQIKLLILLLIFLIFNGCTNSKYEMVNFTSDKGRFSAIFPGHPTESKEVIQAGDENFNQYIYQFKKRFVEYSVVYLDAPGDAIYSEDAEELLDRTMEQTKKQLNLKIIKAENIEFGDDPGREYVYTNESGKKKGISVIVLSGNRLYIIDCKGSKFLFPTEKAQTFIDSLTIW